MTATLPRAIDAATQVIARMDAVHESARKIQDIVAIIDEAASVP